ncbi:MAG: DUF2341 domain-containing protein [Kiritimatiellae bacterium]|nr:DUF2341 domain-containing protein [Kiritimatiellia bacterium]
MKNMFLSVGAAVAALVQLCPAAHGAGSDYAYQSTFTVVGAAEGVTLEHFPVLVRVSPERIDGFAYSQLSSPEDGADLRFTDADGNFLNHDIDTWNPDGESLVWVSVPVLENGAFFTMRWGNASPAETNDPAAVWSAAGYVQVWHFSTGVATDATGRGLQPKASGGFVQSSDAFLGGCYTNEFAGSVIEDENGAKTWSYIDLGNHDALLSDVRERTVTGWFRQDGNFADSNEWTTYFSNKNSLGDKGINFVFFNKNMWAYGDGQDVHAGGWSGLTYSVGSWMHVCARYRLEEGKVMAGIFRDGGAYFSETEIEAGVSKVSGVFSAGNYGGYHSYHNRPFHGDIDEIRVYDGAASAEWIREERNTAWSGSYLVCGGASGYAANFVAFLRKDGSAVLPPECGEATATFEDDVFGAVEAAVAAKTAGAPVSTVYVAPGEYIATAPLRATNGVHVIGLGSASDVVFAGKANEADTWNYRVMNFSGGGLLANVTVRGNRRTGFDDDDGKANSAWNEPCRWGGTMLLGAEGDPVPSVASNLVVTGGYNGRWQRNEFLGTVAVRGTALLMDSEISGNKIGGYGGGVFADGDAAVLRCRITGNSTWDLGVGKQYGGGVNLAGCARLVDCLVAGNETGGPGGGVHMDLNVNLSGGGIYHCTIADNVAEGTGSALFVNTNKGLVMDSIVAGGDGAFATGLSSAGNVAISNCCFGVGLPAAFTSVSGVVVADPQFKPGAGNYNLLATSPCIDAATVSAPIADLGLGLTTSWIALNGVPHCHDDAAGTFDGLPDIGCYESTAANAKVTVLVFR